MNEAILINRSYALNGITSLFFSQLLCDIMMEASKIVFPLLYYDVLNSLTMEKVSARR